MLIEVPVAPDGLTWMAKMGHELPWLPTEAGGPTRSIFLVGEGRVTSGERSSPDAPDGWED